MWRVGKPELRTSVLLLLTLVGPWTGWGQTFASVTGSGTYDGELLAPLPGPCDPVPLVGHGTATGTTGLDVRGCQDQRALVVSESGGVRWALVTAEPRVTFPSPPSRTVSLDQLASVFIPRVVLLRLGDTLEVLSSDPERHTVHLRDHDGSLFNVGMPVFRTRFTTEIVRPGLYVASCSVHSQMQPTSS